MSTESLAQILKASAWTVELHKLLFVNRGEIPDHEWIPVVAARGCVIITSDKSMKGWREENGKVRSAIERSKAKIFFVRGAGLTIHDQAHAIGLARRHLCRLVRKHAGTFVIARIHTKGSRVGEVQMLHCGGRTRTEKKYGE